MKAFTNPLKRLILPALWQPRRYFQQRENVIHPALPRGRREWIVARSLCHYRLFNLEDIPSARQEAALQHKIRQWCPFLHYGEYSVWRGNQVQVWVWDQQRQQAAVNDLKLKPMHCIPETVLRARPSTDTVRLMPCLEGLEAQAWQRGLLIHSRWWAAAPTKRDWHSFQRAGGLRVSDVPEVVDTPALLNQPWGRPRRHIGGLNLRQERPWVLLGLAITVIVASWQAVDIFKWQSALRLTNQRIETLSDGATPILTARNQAVADRMTVQRLQNLTPYPAQLIILSSVATNLPDPDARLLDWTYQSGELRFTLEASDIDPRIYVETFQSLPLFQAVKSESGRTPQQIVISLQLVRQ